MTGRWRRWATPLLLAIATAVVVGGWILAGVRSGDGAREFLGTDTQAVEALRERGVTPWTEPLTPAPGPSVESGLFAIQAALGGGLLGYVLGRFARPAPTPPVAAADHEPGPSCG